jgi:hypothetical protein
MDRWPNGDGYYEPEDIRSATLDEQQENKEYKPGTFRGPARSMASSSAHSLTGLDQQARWMSNANPPQALVIAVTA